MTAATADRVPDAAALNDWVQAVGARADAVAYRRLFGYYAPRIKAYLMRGGTEAARAEEIAQDVMVTLWQRAGSFDPTQANASTWVFTIARNRRIDLLRRDRHVAVDPADPALVPDQAAAEAADPLEQAAEAARLHDAVGTLPDEQRQLLELAFFQDQSHAAIAVRCALPLGTVKSRIRLALARLRRELGSP